jgi:hypothetical protein
MASSSVSGIGQSASQYLQQLTGQQSASSGAAPSQGGHRHHRHQVGGAGCGSDGSQAQVSNLLDTISNALQSADASSDPNQVIEDTVSKLLENKGSMAANGLIGNVSADTVQGAASQAGGQQKLLELLKAHGVDLQQFRADLTAAVKAAQSGTANPAIALQSFPPGSALNLTA